MVATKRDAKKPRSKARSNLNERAAALVAPQEPIGLAIAWAAASADGAGEAAKRRAADEEAAKNLLSALTNAASSDDPATIKTVMEAVSSPAALEARARYEDVAFRKEFCAAREQCRARIKQLHETAATALISEFTAAAAGEDPAAIEATLERLEPRAAQATLALCDNEAFHEQLREAKAQCHARVKQLHESEALRERDERRKRKEAEEAERKELASERKKVTHCMRISPLRLPCISFRRLFSPSMAFPPRPRRSARRRRRRSGPPRRSGCAKRSTRTSRRAAPRCSPAHLLTCSPARLLTCSPAHLLTCSPPPPPPSPPLVPQLVKLKVKKAAQRTREEKVLSYWKGRCTALDYDHSMYGDTILNDSCPMCIDEFEPGMRIWRLHCAHAGCDVCMENFMRPKVQHGLSACPLTALTPEHTTRAHLVSLLYSPAPLLLPAVDGRGRGRRPLVLLMPPIRLQRP